MYGTNVMYLLHTLRIILTRGRLLMIRGHKGCLIINYICNMNIKKYDYFVLLAWISMSGVLFGKNLEYGHIYEIALVTFLLIFILYLSSRYISTTLLLKAMKRNSFILFIIQVLIISSVTSLLLTTVIRFCFFLESLGIFPVSDIPRKEGLFIFQNWLEMFWVSTIFNLGFSGIRFYKENMGLRKTLVESQLHMLQAQINPHFMFNVLNHINVLMHKDVDLASDLLLKYSEILRYQLYSGKKKRIKIQEEIQFLKSFIEVEKTRWKDKLDVTCNWNVENNKFELPPLLFITFIENAFKHVSRSDFEKGYVHIDFSQKEHTVQLNIENSKSKIKDKKKSDSGLGLENIKKRLNILCPEKYSLTIKDTDLVYYSELSITI